MKLTFAGRNLQIDGAKIVYRNFAGEQTEFNRKGDRNFSVVIPDMEMANKLIDEGWNVKIKAPREEGDTPFIHLPVKVHFNDRGPSVFVKSGSRTNRFDEDSVGLIDEMDIRSVDLDIRPYDWNVNGKSGRKAYLEAIWVTQEINRFEARLAEEEFPQE